LDYALFKSSPSGEIIKTTHEQWAFVPNPLPPNINLLPLMNVLSQTMKAIGDLNGMSRQIANPYMLIRPLQRLEALTSSSMEGTHASPDELVLLESGEDNVSNDAAREVYNYIKALETAETMIKTLPLSHRLIKAVHSTLLSGMGKSRGANKLPGEYKIHQNFIGGGSIHAARFVPPPPQHTQICMDALENYINSDNSAIPPIIDAALIHYQFECIHPFADGNGRVGRILIPIYLITKGVLDKPLLYISPYIEKHKDRYIDLMYNVSKNGDWLEWIAFFLKAVETSCADTSKTIIRLLDLQKHYTSLAHSVGRSNIVVRLIDKLFEHPVITIPQAADLVNVSYPAAQGAILKLIDLGILSELPISYHPKRFVALDIVRLSSGFAKDDLTSTAERF
jgi:Fic family protein